MSFRCIVKDCVNRSDEGVFEGAICLPCFEFINTGEGIHSQAYRNAMKTRLSSRKDSMTFWVYFDETENGVSVNTVSREPLTHLNNIVDTIWYIEDHHISWQKDLYDRRDEPTSVFNYHVALTQFSSDLISQQIAVQGVSSKG